MAKEYKAPCNVLTGTDADLDDAEFFKFLAYANKRSVADLIAITSIHKKE